MEETHFPNSPTQAAPTEITTNKRMEKTAVNFYRIDYFIQGAFGVFNSLFMSLYFENVQGLDNNQIALLVGLGYLPYLFKPFFGYLIGVTEIKGEHRKYFLIIGGGITLASFIIMSFFPPSSFYWFFLLAFMGAFLGIGLADVTIDAVILDRLQTKNSTAVINQRLFSFLGSQFMGLMYRIFVWDNISNGYWIGLFLVMAIISSFVILLAMNYSDGDVSQKIFSQNSENIQLNPEQYRFWKRTFIIFSIGMILSQLPALFDYSFEPLIVNEFGETGFTKYATVSLTSSLIGILVLPVLYIYRNRVKKYRKAMMILYIAIAVVLWFSLYTRNFSLLLSLSLVVGPISQLFQFAFVSMLIDCTPLTRRSFWYQIYAVIYAGADILFRAIGKAAETSIGYNGLILIIIIGITLAVPVVFLIDPEKFQEVVLQKPLSQEMD